MKGLPRVGRANPKGDRTMDHLLDLAAEDPRHDEIEREQNRLAAIRHHLTERETRRSKKIRAFLKRCLVADRPVPENPF